MRFESYHRNTTMIVQSTSCNKKLLTSVGIKQTLKMCKLMHHLECEKKIKFGATKRYKGKFNFNDKEMNHPCYYYEQVKINSILYKLGTILVINNLEGEVKLGKIIEIIFQKTMSFSSFLFLKNLFSIHIFTHIFLKILKKQKELRTRFNKKNYQT